MKVRIKKMNNKGQSSLPGTLALIALTVLVVGVIHYCIYHDLNAVVRDAGMIALAIIGFLALFILVIFVARIIMDRKMPDKEGNLKSPSPQELEALWEQEKE